MAMLKFLTLTRRCRHGFWHLPGLPPPFVMAGYGYIITRFGVVLVG